MQRFKYLLLISILCQLSLLIGILVPEKKANQAVTSFLYQKEKNVSNKVYKLEKIQDNQTLLAYVYHLNPEGYVVVSADNDLPPVIAYSFNSNFSDNAQQRNDLKYLIHIDIKNRLKNIASVSRSIIQDRHEKWESLINNTRNSREVTQWPPDGSTSTGGWVESRWNQIGYYAQFCPMDLVNNSRSLAGCPALVMSQIVCYHQTFNGTTLNDSDDYHHNYGGNSYWIDNDCSAYDFPDFPTLNSYLDTLLNNLKYNLALNSQDKASIIFATGVAMKQIYTRDGSGTFSLSQALDGYHRFNYSTATLLNPNDPEFLNRIIQNVQDAQPVHLGIVTPAVDAGHNVVVDGYNTDNYFHINYGWGGSQDGWYLIPSEFPLGLTVFEGAIVDILPFEYININSQSIDINTQEELNQPLNIIVSNYNLNSSIRIDTVLFDQNFGGLNWNVQCSSDSLPKTLNFGENMTFTLTANETDRVINQMLETNFKIIYEQGAKNVKIRLNPELIANQDNQVIQPNDLTLTSYPNPFNPSTTIHFTMKETDKATLSIFNIKGEKIVTLSDKIVNKGNNHISWNGKSGKGQQCPSGIYFVQLKTSQHTKMHKIMLLK